MQVQQKHNVHLSWNRSDQEFFSRGACHILCAVFLSEFPDCGFSAALILPRFGLPGRHVIACNSTTIFDWRGFSPREDFLDAYTSEYRKTNPAWKFNLLSVDNPSSHHFCESYNHRRPDQFLHDPVPRALQFIRTLTGEDASNIPSHH